MNLFADRHTRLSVLGFSFPSSWFQSVQPIFVILLAPVFAWLWMRLAARAVEPRKVRLRPLLHRPHVPRVVPAGAFAQQEGGFKVSPWWLVAAYFVSEWRAAPEPRRPEPS